MDSWLLQYQEVNKLRKFFLDEVIEACAGDLSQPGFVISLVKEEKKKDIGQAIMPPHAHLKDSQ